MIIFGIIISSNSEISLRQPNNFLKQFIMKIKILALLLITVCITQIAAKDITITVSTKKEFTGEWMPKAKAWLIPINGNDTIFGKNQNNADIQPDGQPKLSSVISFKVPNENQTFILTTEAEGFEEITRTVTVEKLGGRENEIIIPTLIFHKAAKRLEEVTVTASKVKFYLKGDTIVYNADAFALPEGSLLDALVKQLPGVEIRNGGEIYVNGKYVESLLLNGTDFFDNNKELMLNNLGAYTVKDIAVYDKMSERSKLAGRDLGDSQYVMDVRLKREYMSGFVGNIEAGGGTDSRYLGRLFAMWYTVRSRLALIANINNLNDSRKPGQNDKFNATNTPGDFRTKMAGLSYNVNGSEWEFSGNSTVSHTRNHSIETSDVTNFISTGNIYENKFSDNLTHELSLSSDNKLYYRPEGKHLGISQRFGYQKKKQYGNSLSGTFNQEIVDMTNRLLETIYSGQANSFTDISLNSALTQSILSGNTMNVGGGVSYETKVPHTPDLIGFHASADYSRSHYHIFDFYDIVYNRDGSHSLDNTFTQNRPDHKLDMSASISYTYLPNDNISLLFNPAFFHTHSIKDSYFYRLDRLSDSGLFGYLPPDYQSSIDYGQSYLSTTNRNDAYFQIAFNAKFDLPSGGKITISLKPVAEYIWNNLDYRQKDFSQFVKHNALKLWFYNTFIAFIKGQEKIQLEFNRNEFEVPLTRLITITDNRNPLNIYTGSTHLKNAANNIFELSWQRSVFSRHRWNNRLSATFSFMQNSLTNSYSYNKETGVRTYQMQNVNGDWRTQIYDSFYKTFGSMDQFDVTSTSSFTYAHDVDLSDLTGSEMTKSIVKNTTLSENLRFNWRFSQQNLGINFRIDWRDTRSDKNWFSPFSATTAQYGVNGTFTLPYNFGIATDLNLYTRRGYAYKELNTTDVVWNARLTYNLKGGHWTFMLDGFDLLHQLSNVSYTVNAQSRVETYTNVLPRYLLFHVQYRFNKQPKQRN